MTYTITRRRLLAAGLSAVVAHEGIARPRDAEATIPYDLDHEYFMRLAIALGKRVPKHPFGSVVVNIKTKQVVAEGWVRLENPIWHGEMTALNNCPNADTGFDWHEVCLYTTGESCPMCQAAIVWTGMPLVVYGSAIPFLQKQGFGQINIRSRVVAAASLSKQRCRIIGGVLEKECNQLFVEARNMR